MEEYRGTTLLRLIVRRYGYYYYSEYARTLRSSFLRGLYGAVSGYQDQYGEGVGSSG